MNLVLAVQLHWLIQGCEFHQLSVAAVTCTLERNPEEFRPSNDKLQIMLLALDWSLNPWLISRPKITCISMPNSTILDPSFFFELIFAVDSPLQSERGRAISNIQTKMLDVFLFIL